MSAKKIPLTPAYRTGERSFLDLTHAYFGASDILFVRIFSRYRADGDGDSEMLFDPLVFLNRHAIECGLKYFLFSKVVNQPKETHNLQDLYTELLPYIKSIPSSELKPLKEIALFYSKYDTKGGEAFRYPHGKKQEPFTPKITGLQRLELRKFYRNIQKVKKLFFKDFLRARRRR